MEAQSPGLIRNLAHFFEEFSALFWFHPIHPKRYLSKRKMSEYENINSNEAAQQILTIAKSLLPQKEVTILGVCGLGGLGKSTACRLVKAEIGEQACLLETDWYLEHASNDRRKRIKQALQSQDNELIAKWENPSAWYDWSEIITALKTLKEKRELSIINAWNQSTGEKDMSFNMSLPAERNSIILCDGIYLLHPEISKELDYTVMLKGDVSKSLAQGSGRDSHRSSDDYLQFKARLTAEFCVPYFKRFEHVADKVISVC